MSADAPLSLEAMAEPTEEDEAHDAEARRRLARQRYLDAVVRAVHDRRMLGAEDADDLAGNVLVAFTIDGAGRFSGVRMVRGSGDPDLDRDAVRAVRAASGVASRPDILGRGGHGRAHGGQVPVRVGIGGRVTDLAFARSRATALDCKCNPLQSFRKCFPGVVRYRGRSRRSGRCGFEKDAVWGSPGKGMGSADPGDAVSKERRLGLAGKRNGFRRSGRCGFEKDAAWGSPGKGMGSADPGDAVSKERRLGLVGKRNGFRRSGRCGFEKDAVWGSPGKGMGSADPGDADSKRTPFGAHREKGWVPPIRAMRPRKERRLGLTGKRNGFRRSGRCGFEKDAVWGSPGKGMGSADPGDAVSKERRLGLAGETGWVPPIRVMRIRKEQPSVVEKAVARKLRRKAPCSLRDTAGQGRPESG